VKRADRHPSRVLIVAVLLALAAGCGQRADQPPSVLVITLDTTRADHLSCYGYDKETTPRLDALAAEGVLFENCLTPVPITLPSHTTILTGTYPTFHGVRENGEFYAPDELTTMAEVLGPEGYRTAAFVGAFPVSSAFNLDQGFDLFDDRFFYPREDLGKFDPAQRVFFEERKADKVSQAAIGWLEDHGRDPFFMWLHYFDPHHPYNAPSPFDELFPGSGYDAEIALTDDCVGAVFQALRDLGVWENTVVVVTADHGEGLGEHGEETHALMVYNSTAHVPLILKAPGLEPKRVGGTVRTTDILPTVCDLLGLETPAEVQGTSLVPFMAADGPVPDLETYHETLYGPLRFGWSALFGLTHDGWKYIHAPQPELYEVRTDPGETVDRIGERPELAAAMHDRLEALREETRSPIATSAWGPVDQDTLARLEALGYVGSSAMPTGGIDELEVIDPSMANPNVMVPRVFNQMTESRYLISKGEFRRALDILESFRRLDPGSPEAWDLTFAARYSLGEYEAAHEAALEHVRIRPTSAEAHMRLGISLESLGRMDEAIEALHAAAELNPRDPEVQYRLASMLERGGAVAEAEAAYRRSLELEPDDETALLALGDLLSLAGRDEEALPLYGQALQSNPYVVRGYQNRALVLMELGRTEEARSDLERVLEMFPGHLRAGYTLALLEYNDGDLERSEDLLRRLIEVAPESPLAEQARQVLERIETSS
jgi:arylsulfatase A-like enzyme/Flp pilus assembly protein TadD